MNGNVLEGAIKLLTRSQFNNNGFDRRLDDHEIETEKEICV